MCCLSPAVITHEARTNSALLPSQLPSHFTVALRKAPPAPNLFTTPSKSISNLSFPFPPPHFMFPFPFSHSKHPSSSESRLILGMIIFNTFSPQYFRPHSAIHTRTSPKNPRLQRLGLHFSSQSLLPVSDYWPFFQLLSYFTPFRFVPFHAMLFWPVLIPPFFPIWLSR